MDFKKLCISVVGASMILGASIASADTVICYKNPGNNNGHRYVVEYQHNYNRANVSKRVLQFWDGKSYVDASTDYSRRTLHWTPTAEYVCKNLYNYRYYQKK